MEPIEVHQSSEWPVLSYEDWRDTGETLHLLTQIAGKVKLALCPFLNQWWEVALGVSARGLTTGPIPYKDRSFDIEFDFIADRVVFRVSDGRAAVIPLTSRSIAEYYRTFVDTLESLDIAVAISPLPSEIPDAIPLDTDTVHSTYHGEQARTWWRILLATERAINRFRTPFHGKSSPINLFWGGFDLNHTRFNGEAAAVDPKLDRMMRYGENEANFSVGFWPGGEAAPAAFYAYMTPKPEGVERAQVAPDAAQFVPAMGEFFLPYEAARVSDDPSGAVLTFFQSTYEACAALSGWDRTALEGDVPVLGRIG